LTIIAASGKKYLIYALTGLMLVGAAMPSTADDTDPDSPADEVVEPVMPAALNLLSEDEGGGDFAFLQQQIYRGEAANAQRQLETIVSQIEALKHRYDEALIVPLTLIGDALMVQQEFDEALNYYDRARHTARVNYGLFDSRQLAVVYREADAFKKVGDLASAGQREEYAFEVMHKNHGEYDPDLLPGLMRLAKFYLKTYNFLSARSLFNRAMSIHGSTGTAYSLEAVPALQGIALSHRLERFPPFYIADINDNRLSGPTPGLNTSDLDRQYIAFNNFPAGEKALQQIVEIRRRQDPEDKQATFDAILALADWHNLFGKNNTANTLYAHLYEEMAKSGDDPDAFFGQPQLLYLPQPQNPKPPPVSKREQITTGKVQLGFQVSPNGRIRQLQTLASEPEGLMDFRVRRSMRLAVYRPMLIEGVAVAADDWVYTHEFSYYPTAEQVLTASTDEDLPTDADEADPEPEDSNTAEIE
jgi:tetratricopeptide (TPR) repeat protein